MKQDSLVGVVQRGKAPGVEVMVWDRAPSHRGQKVKAVGVKVIEQPVYLSELNPVERVIEELRRCVEGRVYGDLERKNAAIEQQLHRLAADPERVKSLAGWAWIQEAVTSVLFSENMAFH